MSLLFGLLSQSAWSVWGPPYVPQVLCSPLSTKKVRVRYTGPMFPTLRAGLGLQGPYLCSPGPMFPRDEKSC